MATTPLVPIQTQLAMQNVTLNALGIPANDAGYAAVRVGWQTEGAPAWRITEDVVVITALEDDAEYGLIPDWETVPGVDGNHVELLTKYTRIWRVNWSFFGPNSFDHARIVRSSLLRPSQAIHDLLVAASLYLVTEMRRPMRVPEYKDNQWWERTDFHAFFNEGVTETETVQSVASVEVKVEDASGVIADVTVKGG